MDEVRSTRARRSGPHGIVLPGASIGAGTTVGPGSLVTRGDAVPRGDPLAGQPDRDVALSRKPSGQARPGSTDSYLPAHGNGGYRVEHYDLDLDYKLAANRLAGRAVLTAVADTPLSRFSLDLGRVPRAPRARRRPSGEVHAVTSPREAASCTSRRPARSTGRFTVEVRYSGNPTPVASRWGDVGWEELTDGALVASQPIGAPSWFPCNDHPADKASYRIAVTTAAPYTVAATGVLTARRRSAGTRTWVYERPEPTASYLVSVQIGRYDRSCSPRARYRRWRTLPARLRQVRRARLRPASRDHDDAGGLLRALPVRRLPARRHRRRAGGPDRGPGHVDLRGQPRRRAAHPRAARRARAGAPVVRQQPHDRRLAPHLAQRGLRDLRGMAVVGVVRRPHRRGTRPGVARARRGEAGRPRPRRPGGGADVRRAGLQARRAGAARPARPDRRRALLRAAARLDGAAPPRDGDHGAVRRPGRAARRHGPRRVLHRVAAPPRPPRRRLRGALPSPPRGADRHLRSDRAHRAAARSVDLRAGRRAQRLVQR